MPQNVVKITLVLMGNGRHRSRSWSLLVSEREHSSPFVQLLNTDISHISQPEVFCEFYFIFLIKWEVLNPEIPCPGAVNFLVLGLIPCIPYVSA